MKTFNTFDSFAKHLEKVVKKYDYYQTKTAHFLGEELVKEAKDKIGHLNERAGPFQAWPELAESTKADKERQGYVFNADYNPLLRTGELRDSISYNLTPSVHGFLKLQLGSDDQIMVYQELGTKYIPPRSVLGATMFQAMPVISYAFGHMLTSWLENKTLNIRKRTHGSI